MIAAASPNRGPVAERLRAVAKATFLSAIPAERSGQPVATAVPRPYFPTSRMKKGLSDNGPGRTGEPRVTFRQRRLSLGMQRCGIGGIPSCAIPAIR
jgi:hypothetical protein